MLGSIRCLFHFTHSAYFQGFYAKVPKGNLPLSHPMSIFQCPFSISNSHVHYPFSNVHSSRPFSNFIPFCSSISKVFLFGIYMQQWEPQGYPNPSALPRETCPCCPVGVLWRRHACHRLFQGIGPQGVGAGVHLSIPGAL